MLTAPQPYSRPALLPNSLHLGAGPASQAPNRSGLATLECRPTTKAHPALGDRHHHGCRGTTGHRAEARGGQSCLGLGAHLALSLPDGPGSTGPAGAGTAEQCGALERHTPRWAHPTLGGPGTSQFAGFRQGRPSAGLSTRSTLAQCSGSGEGTLLWGLALAPPRMTPPEHQVALSGPPQYIDQQCQTSAPQRQGRPPFPERGPLSQPWGCSWQLWGSTGPSPRGGHSPISGASGPESPARVPPTTHPSALGP